jgi:hypothetical protein
MKSSSPVVRVELTGGLANQLFQWASGELARRASEATLELDSRLVDRPDGRGEQITKLIKHAKIIVPSEAEIVFWRSVHEHLPRPMTGALKRIRRGSFALERVKAVDTYEQAVRELTRGVSVRMTGLLQDAEHLWRSRETIAPIVRNGLSSYPTPTTRYSAVHVRRGDYVSVEKYRRIFGVCSAAYYSNAIERLPRSLPVHIVSDEPDWADAVLVKGANARTHTISVHRGRDHYEDLALLARAEHLVLSNSTFSWWAAFLSSAQGVICPEPWFTDPSRDRGIARPDWIRVDRG